MSSVVDIIGFIIVYFIIGTIFSIGYIHILHFEEELQPYQKIIAIFIFLSGIFSIPFIPIMLGLVIYKMLFKKD